MSNLTFSTIKIITHYTIYCKQISNRELGWDSTLLCLQRSGNFKYFKDFLAYVKLFVKYSNAFSMGIEIRTNHLWGKYMAPLTIVRFQDDSSKKISIANQGC